MTQQLVQGAPAGPLAAFADRLPPMIACADDRTAWRFVDFFAVTIRNPNTREAYYRAVSRFMDWCEQHGLHRLAAIRPIHVAAYVEQLPLSRPSVRQHLSAISRCFDWMVSGGTLDTNPATSVQRPKHVVRVGRTPVLSDDQARMLLESISIDKVAGLRDRALIGDHALHLWTCRSRHRNGRRGLQAQQPPADIPAPREGRQGAPRARTPQAGGVPR